MASVQKHANLDLFVVPELVLCRVLQVKPIAVESVSTLKPVALIVVAAAKLVRQVKCALLVLARCLVRKVKPIALALV